MVSTKTEHGFKAAIVGVELRFADEFWPPIVDPPRILRVLQLDLTQMLRILLGPLEYGGSSNTNQLFAASEHLLLRYAWHSSC